MDNPGPFIALFLIVWLFGAIYLIGDYWPRQRRTDKAETRRKLRIGFADLGLETEEARGSTVLISGQAISRVWHEASGGNSYGETEDFMVYEVVDSAMAWHQPRQLHVRPRLRRAAPIFGHVIGAYWDGYDGGLGVLERLNSGLDWPSTRRFEGWVEGIRSDPHLQTWLIRTRGYGPPDLERWESLKRIAELLLALRLVEQPSGQAAREAGRQTGLPLGFLPATHQMSQIVELASKRCWLWMDSEKADRDRYSSRVWRVALALPQFCEQAAELGLFPAPRSIVSVYLIGSYPWVPFPSDVDLFIVVQGEYEWTYHNASELEAVTIETPGLLAVPTLEVVGKETLMRSWLRLSVDNPRRVSLRRTLLFGSTLLAGEDLVGYSRPEVSDFDDLHQDLLADAKHADWPELGDNKQAVKRKKAWREYEAKALRRFVSAMTAPPP